MECYKLSPNQMTRILLVEDQPLLQKIHKRFLEQLNCLVDVSPNGLDAIEKSSEKYDLIFMDLDLPDVHGTWVTKVIKSSRNPNKTTPIVALTACTETSVKKRCFESGMVDFANKPVGLEGLKKLLAKHCAKDR